MNARLRPITTTKLVAAAVLVSIASTAAPAHAATPATAMLSSSKRSVSWKGTAMLSSPFFVISELDCNLVADPSCDHFALRLDLADGAKVEITLKAEDPADPEDPAKAYNDWDVYIYAPGSAAVPPAAPIAIGAEIGDESLTFIHRARYGKQPYDIAIRSWLSVPGSTYTATAKVMTLGR